MIEQGISIMQNYLFEGDPMQPASTDLIIQRGMLPVGERIPRGWNVISGNIHYSVVYRVTTRYTAEKTMNHEEDQS